MLQEPQGSAPAPPPPCPPQGLPQLPLQPTESPAGCTLAVCAVEPLVALGAVSAHLPTYRPWLLHPCVCRERRAWQERTLGGLQRGKGGHWRQAGWDAEGNWMGSERLRLLGLESATAGLRGVWAEPPCGEWEGGLTEPRHSHCSWGHLWHLLWPQAVPMLPQQSSCLVRPGRGLLPH